MWSVYIVSELLEIFLCSQFTRQAASAAIEKLLKAIKNIKIKLKTRIIQKVAPIFTMYKMLLF